MNHYLNSNQFILFNFMYKFSQAKDFPMIRIKYCNYVHPAMFDM